MNWIKVSKQQFDDFIKTYPRSLRSDVSLICEPPERTFYDFSVEGPDYMNAVACEVRDWISPDGEVDSTDHRKFWTYAIQGNTPKADIAKRVAETCAQVGINLKP